MASPVDTPAPPLAFLNPRLSTKNVGDYFIEDSAKRILRFDPDKSIDVDPRQPVTDETIERINACHAAVILGTNLWYRDVSAPGRWTLDPEQLKKIHIPIIPLGVGTTRHQGEDNGFHPTSIAILKHLHDSCEQGSVRDTRTLEALESAGIKNLAMTGCPTLFRSCQPEWQIKHKPTRRLTLTVRKGQARNIRALARLLQSAGWDLTVAAQQEKDNYFRRWIPLRQKPLPTIYEYRLETYLKLAEESYGAIGWRLHGNMLNLALGNPAIFFANCSRAASFCEAFELPCRWVEDRDVLPLEHLEEAVRQLSDASTFDPFRKQYAAHYGTLRSFLDRNQLPHNLPEPTTNAA